MDRSNRFQHPRRRLMSLMLLSIFIAMYSFYLMAPFASALIQHFALHPLILGSLSASFFLFAALFLIPMSLMIEAKKPQYILLLLLVLAGCGGLIFATSTTPFGLTLGRALMGGSYSIVLLVGLYEIQKGVCALYLVAYIAAVILATYPTFWLLDDLGFRVVFLLIGLFTLGIGVLQAIMAIEPHAPVHRRSFEKSLIHLKALFALPTWWLMLIPLAVGGGTWMAYQSLWIVVWLERGIHVTKEVSMQCLTASAGGLALGTLSYFLLAKAWEWIQRYLTRLILIMYALSIALGALLSIPFLTTAPLCWFIYAYVTGMLACITLMQRSKGFLGLQVIAAKLTAFCLYVFFLQIVIGVIVSFCQKHLYHYPLVGFQLSFIVAMGFNGLFFIIVWIMAKKKRCLKDKKSD